VLTLFSPNNTNITILYITVLLNHCDVGKDEFKLPFWNK
jgi:hypothetical protein